MSDLASNIEHRHPSTQHFGPLFAYDHLPPRLATVSKVFHDAASSVILTTPDGPELSAGLRKLLEAKDCVVRAHVLAMQSEVEL